MSSWDPVVEAVIVAGGLGTRMRPLTDRRPKHLLPVGGVPFVEHQIAKLVEAGIGHVVLATSYHADQFRPTLGDGGRFGIRISYVTEEVRLGTAGAIRNVAPLLASDPEHPVVVLNGDVLSGHDLPGQLTDFERPREGRTVDVSLHLVEVEDARPFGCVPLDAQGRVLGFVEKSETPMTNRVNAGCYVFRRRVIDAIPPGREVSVERETFPALIEEGAVLVGYVDTAYWRDVGSPEALVAASRDVVRGVAPTPRTEPAPDGARVLPGAEVHGEVADGAVVLRDAVIEDGAVVRGSVVMDGARVSRGATVVDSVLGPGSTVEEGAELEGVTLGDDSRVRAQGRPAPGTRIACGSVWP